MWCILPLQCGPFVQFWIGVQGFHKQLFTSHNDYTFFNHARRRVIEASRRDETGVRAAACPGHSSLAPPRDVSVARKSKPTNQSCRGLFVNIFYAVPGVRSFEVLALLPSNSCSRCLHVKIHEDSWRHCEVVLRSLLHQHRTSHCMNCPSFLWVRAYTYKSSPKTQ